MAKSASISANIAGRYAQAVFDIANDEGTLDILASQNDELAHALDGSADLRAMIDSPVLSRDVQGRAIAAIARKMDLSDNLASTLALMARNRRLFALPQFVDKLRMLIAEAHGEVRVDVTSAVKLTAAQKKRLTETLAAKSGRMVKLDTRVDDSLIGGMIVKMGSQMIDSSIRSKLASLQNAMKEVG